MISPPFLLLLLWNGNWKGSCNPEANIIIDLEANYKLELRNVVFTAFGNIIFARNHPASVFKVSAPHTP